MLSHCYISFLYLGFLLAFSSAFAPPSYHLLYTMKKSRISSSALDVVPEMIVFDLDNTLWTPELYQLRSLQRKKAMPKAGVDVELFPGAKSVLESIRSDKRWSDVTFAVASRTKLVDWAHDLLDQFGIRDLFHHVEIFPGDKVAHFNNLQEKSGVPFDKILFFDDSRGGRFGNCVPVSKLGVLSVHCPDGLHTEDIFHTAVDRFASWAMDGRKPNRIIERDGSMTELPREEQSNERVNGVVKSFFRDRGFGFISYGTTGTKDLFFHVRDINNGSNVLVGDKVTFFVQNDQKTGKKKAGAVEKASSPSSLSSSSSSSSLNASSRDSVGTVNMRVFSMNQPFAALLANGYKTLETRNGTMFTPYKEGTKFLLHVGRRRYPDGDRHIDVMKSGGLEDAEIERLKSLPSGFESGMAVAILEIGRTFETTTKERSDPEFQRNVCALGEDSGRMVTEIRRVAYLKRPVRVSGKGGVFKADIPCDVFPDGWMSEDVSEGISDGKRLVYSISG